MKRTLQPYSTATSFRPVLTLRDLVIHLKDPLPLEEHTEAMHSISCSRCHDHYIKKKAETSKQDMSIKQMLKYSKVKKTALTEHAWTHKPQINWTSTKVLGSYMLAME